jgi:putative redox protein
MIHNISWLGDLKFKAEWNGLEIISHETSDMKNLVAMPPGAIFAASLGLCTASRIIGTCQKKGWTVKDLKIKLDPTVNFNEWRTDAFKLDIELQADLTEEQRRELLAEAHNCFVHRTLKHGPEISLNLLLT